MLNEQNESLMVRLKYPLKKRLETIAKSERRTLENQTLCLIESGLRVLESRIKNMESREEVLC